MQSDVIKDQLIAAFESWYSLEFEVPEANFENTYNKALQEEME